MPPVSNLSMPKDKIKIVLLENVHDNAVAYFRSHGYENIEVHKGALDADALKFAISDAHMVGIRSRTKLTRDVLEAAEKLFCIGAFCIGTNQIDLAAAADRGIPSFNAPYSNTRSVAELVLGEIIMLARGIPRRNWICHDGGWDKSAKGSTEVRNKTLGIVGYGHIGTQLSVIAEALGMNVRYYDIVDKLPMGNATPCASLQELMSISDFVSLHVPDTAQTRNMITDVELGWMKTGSFLINAARGKVVDIEALADHLRTEHLAGAAIDVFPVEPAGVEDEFTSPLRGMKNVLLTPHIGGSTAEAQANIGTEVAEKLVKYSDNGSTVGAVNFPEVMLPMHVGGSRFMHIHRNVPGVISRINDIFGKRGLNIVGQYLRTDETHGYVVVDVDAMIEPGMGIRRELEAIDGTIRTRFLNCDA